MSWRVSQEMDSNARERNFASFGLFRRGTIKAQSKRLRLYVAAVAAGILVVTAVCFAVELNRSGREKSKVKRFVDYADSMRVKPADVAIVPEVHPNHRYGERVAGGAAEIDRSSGSGDGDVNNIRDILRRIETRRAEEERQTKPILLKGVYEKKTGDEEAEEEYVRKINDMLEKDWKGLTENTRNVYSRWASPFQLKSEGNDAEALRNKIKKPITVMLDIYPVPRRWEGEEAQQSRLEPVKVRPGSGRLPARGIPYSIVPMRKGQALRIPNGNRMIMRLNLYPKTNRRTFRPFSKKRVCRLEGHRFGKPVTAEWINDHGDWIKANYVTVKYLDR